MSCRVKVKIDAAAMNNSSDDSAQGTRVLCTVLVVVVKTIV